MSKVMPPFLRPGFDEWALKVARAISARGDCKRRQVGSVILDINHRIAGSGYNGTPPGGPSCLDGECPRASSDVEPGSSYDTGPGTCIALHSEQNAILDAENRFRLKGATLYCTERPCFGCQKMIDAVGIERVVTPKDVISEDDLEYELENEFDCWLNSRVLKGEDTEELMREAFIAGARLRGKI